jgi:FMN-dependent NADH-azoreductase
LRSNNKKIKRKKAQTLLTKPLIDGKQKQNEQDNHVALHLHKKVVKELKNAASLIHMVPLFYFELKRSLS